MSSTLAVVRMAERSKALRSGRSPLLWAWVRIPLLTSFKAFGDTFYGGNLWTPMLSMRDDGDGTELVLVCLVDC